MCPKMFQCEFCDKSFKNKNMLKIHLKATHNLSHLCQKCTKSFETKDLLKAHIEGAHLDSKKAFPCDKCDKILMSEFALKNHVTAVHEKDVKVIKCYKCNKPFLTKKGLIYHQKVCGQEFKCEVCDKNFYTDKKLNLHIKTVHKKKKVKCEKCDDEFDNITKLREHDHFKHDPVYQFKCDQCPKAYTGEYNLIHHKSMAHRKIKVKPNVAKRAKLDHSDSKEHIENEDIETNALVTKVKTEKNVEDLGISPDAFCFDSDITIKTEIKQEIKDEPFY